MINTRAADPKAPHVQKFCASIVPDILPFSMVIRTEVGFQPLDCFSNVRQKVRRLGGKIIFGWSIWEWPNVYIEAEHHAIYESPDGLLIDVTPSEDNSANVRTFLPDSSAVYDFANEGVRRDNHRLTLASDPIIERFFQTAREYNRIMSAIPGVGEVSVDVETVRSLQNVQLENQRLLFQLLMRYTPKGAACFCGSGLKFKRCHGEGR